MYGGYRAVEERIVGRRERDMIRRLFARDHASGGYGHVEERRAAGPGETAPRLSTSELDLLED